MLDLADFVQLGVGGIAIVSAYLIVKEVLRSQRDKDIQFIGFIKKQEDNFNELVKNHLNHNSEAMRNLEGLIKEFYYWFKKNNNNK